MLASTTLALLLAASAPDEAEPLRAGLEVDASAVGEAGEVLGKRLSTRGQAVLREAEVLSPRDADDPQVHVTVEALPEDAGYRCAYEVRRNGEPIEGTRASTECRLCTDVELESQFTAAIERLVAKIPREETTSTDTVPPPSTATPVVDEAPRPWAIGRMGQAGIGVSVVGGATLGVGLGLAIAGARSSPTQTSGIVVAAVGGAVLVTGIVLLAVDRSRSTRVTATAAGVRVRF
jgi:hypothetical protein